jgi:microcystin-dependent protein
MRFVFGGLGLDTMGNTAAGRAAGVPTSIGDATTPGSRIGETRHTISIGEMPSHDHGGSTGAAGAHSHTYSKPNTGGSYDTGAGNIGPSLSDANTSAAPNHQHTVSAQGGGAAHNNTPLAMPGTWYIKL